MSENKVRLRLNNQSYTEITVPWKFLISRSNLFKQIHMSCQDKQEVQLKVERPEKFSVLLHYIMHGEMSKEMTTKEVFASYINDAMYLEITELEDHFLDMMEIVCKDGEYDKMDFTVSPPNRDFMDRFLREKHEDLVECQDNLLQLLLKWIKEAQVDQTVLRTFSGLPLKVTTISVTQIIELLEKFPEVFDCLIASSSVVSIFQALVVCVKCNQKVRQADLISGFDQCFGYDSNGYFFNGSHQVQD